MATQSDLAVLLDMGFEKERAELAVKKTGGLQAALQWLEDNQEKSMEQITAENSTSQGGDDDETNPNIQPAALTEGEVAQSLVCEECGRKFRSINQAQLHGDKTGHENFAESTEEIAPLTEEEKKERLAELKARVAEKRAKQAIIDAEEKKKNEKIRMKSTREVQDLKEEMAKKEQIKAAESKRAEKLADIAAKKRIQEKIAADKEERRLKAAKEKAEREGRALPEASVPATVAPSASGPRPAPTEARLRLQSASGTITKTYSVEITLLEIAQALEQETGLPVVSFSTNFPRKTFTGPVDMGMTVKEAGWAPSMVVIVK